MTLYTRRQLLLVLVLAGAAAAGLAVDHWRRARPDLVERLEALDRARPASPALRDRGASPAAGPRASAPPGRRAADRDVAAGARAGVVDVNRASEAELAGLPGIGPTLAARIVAARPFGAVDDLRRVRGLRRITLERVRPLVTTGPAPPAE